MFFIVKEQCQCIISFLMRLYKNIRPFKLPRHTWPCHTAHRSKNHCTSGCQALIPPSWSLFLTVCSETCTKVAHWRSFCWALAVLHLFLPAYRSRYQSCCWVVALLRPCSALLMYWPVSWCLLHTLETVLGDTANFLAKARMDVPTWRTAGLPVQPE